MLVLEQDFQIIAICGRNKRLYNWFERNKKKFRKPLFFFPYVDFMHKIMDFSDIIVTKGGGITVSEALAKGLAMIVTNPIPGQEELNVEYLLRQEAIILADDTKHIGEKIEELISDKKRMYRLKERAKELSFIDSSLRIVDLIEELIS